MKNKGQIIFFVVLGIVVLGIYALIRNRGYIWAEEYPQYAYHDKCEEPFGLSVLYKLTQELYKSADVVRIEKSIERELPLDAAPNASYLMISHNTFFTPKERNHLQKWVENGGIVLISAKTIDVNLFKKVTALDTLMEANPFEDGAVDLEEDVQADSLQEATVAIPEEEDEVISEMEEVEGNNTDSVAMAYSAYENRRIARFDSFAQFTLVQPLGNLSGKHFTFTFPQQNVAQQYYWSGLATYFLDSLQDFRPQPLGYIKDSIVNFMAVNYGKGVFLLHSNPIAFANYHLLRDEGKAYCSGVLSYLRPNGDLYWDESNKRPDWHPPTEDGERSPNILDTMLKEKSLAYAWYVLMFMVLTYLFVGARRRQRSIPILPQRTNTSMEFVETISDLHFAQRDYDKLCRQKMRHFLSHLRERYGVTIPVVGDNGQLGVEPKDIDRIVALSEAPRSLVEDIFNKYQNITTFEAVEQTLLDFHFAIEQFMKWKK